MSHRFQRRVLLAGAGALLQASRAAAQEIVRLPRKVRVGVFGTEGHTNEILNPLKRLPDVQVVAVAGRRAENLLKRAPEAKLYPSLEAMLSDAKLDVAAICNDNGGRAAAILACAAAGVNTLAEKPFAINRTDLGRVREAARKIRLGTLLPMRFDPQYLAMRRVVRDGTLGEVAQVASQKSYQAGSRDAWFLKRETYGSTILWIGIHMIDLMRFTTGRDMKETAGFASHIGFPQLGEMDNVTVSMFRFDNGALGTLRMDYLRSPKSRSHGDDRLRIAGTQGILEYDQDRGLVLMTADRAPGPLTDLPPGQSVFVDFLEHVYAGKPTLLPMDDIWRANEVTLAAHEAAVQKRILPA